AVIYRRDHARVGDQWSEGLHHVERERRLSVPKLMIEAAIRIEANSCQRDGPIAYEKHVGKRQEGVYRIRRRLAVAVREVEREASLVAVPLVDHVRERAKVSSCGGTLDAEQFLHTPGSHGLIRVPLHGVEQRLWLLVAAPVTTQKCPSVENLGLN